MSMASEMRQSRPIGRQALTAGDDGSVHDPATSQEWREWVSAGRTRNWCNADPLLDWLERHGRDHGFVPDDEAKGFDRRTDFLSFILDRGRLFEDRVLALVEAKVPVVRIGSGWEDSRDLAKGEATVEAMRAGAPVIAQAVLRNPENRTYGSADLLVRSDVLGSIVPGALDEDAAHVGAPGIGAAHFHYRVVDIKYTTLQLVKEGHAGSEHLAYMAQVWVYNEALGRILGYVPPAAFLLGRSWETSSDRGTGCFERLARVDHDAVVGRDKSPLADTVAEALAWMRRLRRDGASWRVLPVPSVPDLYPHARNSKDAPWHGAESEIAAALAELTLLPFTSPALRRDAHARGLLRWDDPRIDAASLGITTATYAARCDAVLLANRSAGAEVVFPERITLADDGWRHPAPLELYVDFETVSSLADDFTRLPEIGGLPLIFQVGCGWLDGGEWRFWQGTARRLDVASEAEVIDGWMTLIEGLLADRGLAWERLQILHWSPAESSNLDNAYNAARSRHPEKAWPAMPWFDVLATVIRAQPVSVRGAFGFGLKGVVKGMHAARLIETTWGDGPTDGLGAMIGAWWCDAEAARLGGAMTDVDLMQEIARYNEVDCRAMAEVVGWLREHR